MNGFANLRVSLALLCMVMSSSAVGQNETPSKQTPESAIAFLMATLPQVSVTAEINFGDGYSNTEQFISFDRGPQDFTSGRSRQIINVFPEGPCGIGFDLVTPEERYTKSGLGKMRAIPAPRRSIDFSKLTDVREDPKAPTRLQLVGQGTVISVASENLRPRIAFALEFLRQHCDPAAATGF